MVDGYNGRIDIRVNALSQSREPQEPSKINKGGNDTGLKWVDGRK